MSKPSILLTGLRETCLRFEDKFSNYNPIIFPLQEAYSLDYSVPKKEIDYILLTSPKAVEFLNMDLSCRKFISIGDTTSEMIRSKLGSNISISQPQISNSISLASFINSREEFKGKTIVHFCSALTDDYLLKQLGSNSFYQVKTYSLRKLSYKELPEHQALMFFSPSAVEAFLQLYPNYNFLNIKIFSLGEITKNKLKKYNLDSLMMHLV